MAKKRPSDEELKGLLNAESFGPSEALPATDPIATTPMVLDIEHINPYDRNPRRERNPRFEEIRESIRVLGLQQPLVITRRPGENDGYMVKAGGNTRLQIMKELHAATGDDRFLRVHCVFEPWTCESDALTAHLIENETRGELSFVDKAHAVRELTQLLVAETGQSMTKEQLAQAIRDRGYRIDRSLISRMEYVLDSLLPHMPEALRSGLGRPQVQRIRQLENAGREVWLARRPGEEALFETVFGTLLERHDGADWQFDPLRRALENEVAVHVEEEVNWIRMVFDALLAGRQPLPRAELQDAVKNGPAPREPTPPAPSAAPEDAGESDSATDAGTGEVSLDDDAVTDALSESETALAALLWSGRDGPDGLKSLRARAWVLASRIAKRHQLGDIVSPIGGAGCGFLVDFVYTSPDDGPEMRLGRATLWWFLATVSEQFHAPPGKVLPHLPEGWRDTPIATALEADDAEGRAELLAEYTFLRFGHLMGPLVFASLPDDSWTDLLHLMDTYRRLRRQTAETGIELWEDAA